MKLTAAVSSSLAILAILLSAPAIAGDALLAGNRVATSIEWPQVGDTEGFEVLAGRLIMTIPSGPSRISINDAMITVFYPDNQDVIQFELLEKSEFLQEISNGKIPGDGWSFEEFMKVIFKGKVMELPAQDQDYSFAESAQQLRQILLENGNRVEAFEKGPLTVYQLSRSQLNAMEAFILDRERPDQAVHVYAKMFGYEDLKEILAGMKIRNLK